MYKLEIQAENEVVGSELQKQLEAAGNMLITALSSSTYSFLSWSSDYDTMYLIAVTEQELKQVEVLFNEATDNCINLKKPDQ